MRKVLIGLTMILFVAGLAPMASARARDRAAPSSKAAKLLAELKEKLARVSKQLANLGSHQDQVKALHIGLVRLRQVVQKLERAAEAPRTLDRKLDAVKEKLAELERRIAQVRQRKVRVAYRMARRHRGRRWGRARAGYDGGFYVASRSDRYRLVVNGVLRFTARAGEVVGGGVTEPPEELDLLSLNVPTGILGFSGNIFTKKLTYMVELEFGGGNTVALNDFFFNLRTCRFFAISLGQFQTGFTRQQGADPYDTMFVDSSPASLAFGPGRDVGLKLHFYQWKDRLFQELAVYNGAGVNSGGNDNVDFMYQFRMGISPLGETPSAEGDLRKGLRPLRFRISTGYLFHPMPSGRDLDQENGMDNLFVHQIAAEAALIWQGFSLNGEFYYRLEDHGDAVRELAVPEKRLRPYFGGFAQLGYTFKCIMLQLTARYSYVEPVGFWRGGEMANGWSSPLAGAQQDNGDGTSTAVLPESVHGMTVGVNWYVFRQHVKLIVNYQYLVEQNYQLASGSLTRHVHVGSMLVQGRF